MAVVIEPRAYGIAHAARQLAIGKTLLRRMIKDGRVRAVRLGHKFVVPAKEIDRLLGEPPEPRAEP